MTDLQEKLADKAQEKLEKPQDFKVFFQTYNQMKDRKAWARSLSDIQISMLMGVYKAYASEAYTTRDNFYCDQHKDEIAALVLKGFQEEKELEVKFEAIKTVETVEALKQVTLLIEESKKLGKKYGQVERNKKNRKIVYQGMTCPGADFIDVPLDRKTLTDDQGEVINLITDIHGPLRDDIEERFYELEVLVA